jgi:hypothetical protein
MFGQPRQREPQILHNMEQGRAGPNGRCEKMPRQNNAQGVPAALSAANTLW